MPDGLARLGQRPGKETRPKEGVGLGEQRQLIAHVSKGFRSLYSQALFVLRLGDATGQVLTTWSYEFVFGEGVASATEVHTVVIG